jgi:hypothetical protein
MAWVHGSTPDIYRTPRKPAPPGRRQTFRGHRDGAFYGRPGATPVSDDAKIKETTNRSDVPIVAIA